jgi:isopentenyl-diphosphate delta-isomerase
LTTSCSSTTGAARPARSPRPRRTTGPPPLHLAFSCYVVRADGALLLTRRAHGKRTWPGAWTNACCGHPQVGETLREAVTRRLDEELGLTPRRLGMAIADFAKQAAMVDGTTEHELCPVLIASVDREPDVDPEEVDDTEWISWESVVERVRAVPDSLSPWCVEQVRQLARAGVSPVDWLSGPTSAAVLVGLDNPIELGASASTGIGASRLDGGHGPDVSIGSDPGAMVARCVARILDKFVSGKERELVSVDPRLALLVGEIGSLLDAGGKRLRPAFAYWGHRATGDAHEEAVFGPAAAIELLHTFASSMTT